MKIGPACPHCDALVSPLKIWFGRRGGPFLCRRCTQPIRLSSLESGAQALAMITLFWVLKAPWGEWRALGVVLIAGFATVWLTSRPRRAERPAADQA